MLKKLQDSIKQAQQELDQYIKKQLLSKKNLSEEGIDALHFKKIVEVDGAKYAIYLEETNLKVDGIKYAIYIGEIAPFDAYCVSNYTMEIQEEYKLKGYPYKITFKLEQDIDLGRIKSILNGRIYDTNIYTY